MAHRVREKKHRLPLAAYRGPISTSYTACVQRRKPAFRDEPTVWTLLRILTEEVDEQRCVITIYCFMPDHLHVILRGTDDESNSKIAMDAFKQRAGIWLADHRPTIELQRNFHDHIIRKSESWQDKVRYVAMNPVRGGLVTESMDYPFLGSVGVDLAEVLHDANRERGSFSR